MTKYKIAIIAGLIVAVIIGTILFILPSDKKKIGKQFDLLEQWVAENPSKEILTMGRWLNEANNLFSKKCDVNTPFDFFNGHFTREEIASYVLQGRAHFTKLKVSFSRINITISPEAIAKVTAMVRINGDLKTGEVVKEVYEIECGLNQEGSRWLFNKLEVTKILESFRQNN